MAKVSENALRLAGFLLAHATWIVSELPSDEVYVPQALCLKDGQLVLNVFEADTQVEAVARGKAFLESQAANFDGCAFARDGLVRTEDGPVDVLTVDLTDEDGAFFLSMVQAYSKKETTHLLGPEAFVTPEGAVLTNESSESLRPSVRQGAASHEGAQQSWSALNSSRLPSPGLF